MTADPDHQCLSIAAASFATTHVLQSPGAQEWAAKARAEARRCLKGIYELSAVSEIITDYAFIGDPVATPVSALFLDPSQIMEVINPACFALAGIRLFWGRHKRLRGQTRMILEQQMEAMQCALLLPPESLFRHDYYMQLTVCLLLCPVLLLP
jgi:hypothetical protein